MADNLRRRYLLQFINIPCTVSKRCSWKRNVEKFASPSTPTNSKQKTRQLRSFLSWEPCREFAYFNICTRPEDTEWLNTMSHVARNNAKTLVDEPALRFLRRFGGFYGLINTKMAKDIKSCWHCFRIQCTFNCLGPLLICQKRSNNVKRLTWNYKQTLLTFFYSSTPFDSDKIDKNTGNTAIKVSFCQTVKVVSFTFSEKKHLPTGCKQAVLPAKDSM